MFAFFLQADFLLFVRPHLFEGLSSSSFDFLYVEQELCQTIYRQRIVKRTSYA